MKSTPSDKKPAKSAQPPIAENLIALAEIARPHGVRGELRLKLYNRDSDLLCNVNAVVVQYPDGEKHVVDVVKARPTNDSILLTLEGCNSREDADDLRGATLLVPRSALPALEPGEFYLCDLIGAKVVSPDSMIGTVLEVANYPSCEALVVKRPEGGTIEIPIVDGVVDSVDTATQTVTLVSSTAFEPE